MRYSICPLAGRLGDPTLVAHESTNVIERAAETLPSYQIYQIDHLLFVPAASLVKAQQYLVINVHGLILLLYRLAQTEGPYEARRPMRSTSTSRASCFYDKTGNESMACSGEAADRRQMYATGMGLGLP